MNDMTNKFNEAMDVPVAISTYYLETVTQTEYNRQRREARNETYFVHRQKGGGQ